MTRERADRGGRVPAHRIPNHHPPAGSGRDPARPPRPISIAQVIGRFDGGGAERLALNLSVGLAELPLTRSYAVALRAGGLSLAQRPAGVGLTELGIRGAGPWTLLRALTRFRRLLRERSIDIVHIHGQRAILFCALATLALRDRPRLAFTWHASERVLAERGILLAATRWAIRRCDRVFGPSAEVAALLSRRVRLRAPVRVFRNGVAESTGPPSPQVPGAGPGEPLIVWTARLVPTKDPQLLIRAAAWLRDEGLRFRIVLAGEAPPSSGWYVQQTQDLIRSLDLEAIVTMPGWLDQTADLLRRAAIAVQTSSTEGLSLSLLEQMMAGVAVIATDVGDTATAVRDGQTGLLIQPGDEAGCAAALRLLLTRPRWRSALARRAQDLARREFTVGRMATLAAAQYAHLFAPGDGLPELAPTPAPRWSGAAA